MGCDHVREEITMGDGTKAVLFKYKMENFMRSCVEKYLEHAPGLRLKHVDTPFLPEDQALSPQGAPPYGGPCLECPWCFHSFPTANNTFANAKELEKRASTRRKKQKEELAAEEAARRAAAEEAHNEKIRHAQILGATRKNREAPPGMSVE